MRGPSRVCEVATGPNPSEHRAMGWAAIGAALVGIGGVGGGTLATVGAGSHLWGDNAFLAGFAFACLVTAAGVYVLIAEFIGGLPLPPTRHEREARRSQAAQSKPPSLLPRGNALIAAKKQHEESIDLKDQLRKGLGLKGILDAQEDSKPPHTDDPVYHWARATWVALQHQRPLVAKGFFGDKSPYASAYFSTAYGIEVDRVGRRAYLDGRIAILAEAVEPKSGPPENSMMSNIDRMNLIATKQAERAAERVAQEPLLADRLASLYGAFQELRENVKPARGPSYRLVRHALKQPIEVVLEQKRAERLDGAVRRLLVEQAQRFVPDWDEAASLPPNEERSPGIPMLTADAKQVAAFLDAKAAVLRRIISELREGR